jgi:hypothetical protein
MSAEKLKARVKTFEEISKTFVRDRFDSNQAYFHPTMGKFCGKEIYVRADADTQYDYVFYDESGTWYFTRHWLEIIEDTQTDKFILAELNEMLSYFLRAK